VSYPSTCVHSEQSVGHDAAWLSHCAVSMMFVCFAYWHSSGSVDACHSTVLMAHGSTGSAAAVLTACCYYCCCAAPCLGCWYGGCHPCRQSITGPHPSAQRPRAVRLPFSFDCPHNTQRGLVVAAWYQPNTGVCTPAVYVVVIVCCIRIVAV
jgi:hypothetical protein